MLPELLTHGKSKGTGSKEFEPHMAGGSNITWPVPLVIASQFLLLILRDMFHDLNK